MPAFYTYKPGTKGSGLKLLPGQTLGFQKGKGYYAKPGGAPAPYPGGGPAEPKSGGGGNPYAPPVRPAPKRKPIAAAPTAPAAVDPYAALSQEEIDRRATELAQAGLTPQQAEIRRQQALAAAGAKADEAAITGFQTAAGDLMGKLGPQAEAGFLAASREEGDLGQGMATGVRDDLTARASADQAFAESQGQSGGHTVDPNAAHDVIYGLNGQIPGDTFAEQGAAENAWGLAQAPIALNAGREELSARMAQARTDNDGYAQQLIQLAATEPGLKAQALQQLNQYEIDKANYRESVRTHTADIASQKRQDALAARSEHAQEVAAGVTAKNNASALSYKWASLQFQNDKAVMSYKAAVAKGEKPSPSLSKVYGHVVDANGKAILDASGNQIPVAKSATANSPRGKALKAKADATGTARVNAFKYATKLRGTPVKAPKGSQGAYVAGPGAKYGVPGGVFPPAGPGSPATTNNPERAAHAGGAANYADAQTKVWGEIDGDGLMARYGYSKQQVMSMVNDALRRAGWKRK